MLSDGEGIDAAVPVGSGEDGAAAGAGAATGAAATGTSGGRCSGGSCSGLSTMEATGLRWRLGSGCSLL